VKILVTGGSGSIGRYVVRELTQVGHEVTNADVAPPGDSPGHYLRVDLTESGEVYQALTSSRAEAVVHLGAWANAGIVADSRTYGDNVQGAFNIFQACADLGIKRIVYASSAQVYGFDNTAPVYAPVDEDHPLRPTNCYALSKMAAEQAADYFIANFDLTILSFRFMGVRPVSQIPSEIEKVRQDPAHASWLLWNRTDARDAALACRLAVEKDNVPSGPYNITGGIVLSKSAESLVQQYFGEQTQVKADLTTRYSLLSCDRAEAAFGYHPRYLWSETQQHPEM
jgi:nucleoside-diphosphate-sugar epimerase